jgi:hypothetical protein
MQGGNVLWPEAVVNSLVDRRTLVLPRYDAQFQARSDI